MKKNWGKLVALLLSLTMLLSGCNYLESFQNRYDPVSGQVIISYDDMKYVRPDMEEIRLSFQDACDVISRSSLVSEVVDAIYRFYDSYDLFFTYYNMAYIEYCCNIADTYWEEEYNFCLSNSTTVESYLEQLYQKVAKSNFKTALETDEYFGAGFFDMYQGDTMIDQGYLNLAEKENKLLEQYYDVVEASYQVEYYSEEYFSKYGTQMLDIYIELIKVRQELANYVGYNSYLDFAYDNYYYRDYTPNQVKIYLDAIMKQLSDDYARVCDSNIWALNSSYCSEADTIQYLKEVADTMGGNFQSAFHLLEEGKMYNISYDENKYDISFETYLWSYTQPYIFMSPHLDQGDKLTFAHEFGHFLNDYVCYGSYVGTDVAEIHSQAFEYLSLCYASEVGNLTKYKMATSLCTYVETGAYALFEHKVYDLKPEELTPEKVLEIYEEIGKSSGFDERDWDRREIVCVPHIFTYPLYMISYVVSNDLAMQFYQIELEETGRGLTLYSDCIYSQDSYILDFVEAYGLESPFDAGRLDAVEDTFESILD